MRSRHGSVDSGFPRPVRGTIVIAAMKTSRWSRAAGPILTIAVLAGMAALAGTRWAIPSPALVYLLPVIWSAYAGGMAAGLVSAALCVGFSLVQLSLPGRPFRYEAESFQYALVLTVLVPTIAVLAALLRRRADRRATEQAAAQAGERFRELVDDIDGVVWEADASAEPFRFTFVSRHAESILGFPPARWLAGAAFWPSRIHPDDRERVLAFTREAARGDTRRQIVYRAVTAGGRTVWLRDRMHRTGSAAGAPGMLRGVLTDITEQKVAEEALRASEARKGAILEAALDCIITMDHTGRVTDFNPAAERVFGYRREQAIGRSLAELIIPPEQRAAHATGLARHLAGGEPRMIGRRIETMAVRADGSRLPVELALTRIPGSDPPVFTGFLRDIAERQDTEQELKGTLSLLAATLESTTDGILVVDLEGRIVSSNRKFAEMWRIPREVLDSKDDDRAIAFVLSQLKDPDAFVAKVRELYSSHDAESFDVLEFKDGRIFERYSMPQRIEGASVGRVWSFRDVTGRRQAEAALHESELQLRQSQKMDAIGRLAGGVAHDFNNLLTVILGYCEQMLEHLPGREPLRRAAEEIHNAAERAAALTGQLLAFSRKQMVEPRPLDLNTVVSNTGRMLRRLIGEDVTLEMRLDPDLGRVLADEGQVQQVVLNLAINARDAMPRGGRLTIGTDNADLDEAFATRHLPLVPGRYVRLTIEDTGVGMDADTRSRIFEPFFTTKERGRGTGLGLATVYGIVKQSGGYVWVYSEPGHGSVFKVYLPRITAEVPRPPSAPAVTPAIGTETLLLVEDEAMVRQLVRDMLEKRGYEVLVAGSGEEALELGQHRRDRIHLMVTDVVMPGIGGPEVASRLAGRHPEMKVLYISGYTDDAMLRHGVREGVASFLQKPFTLDALARKVREVLDAGAAVEPVRHERRGGGAPAP
jgi:PAS domain S-box-containing protein